MEIYIVVCVGKTVLSGKPVAFTLGAFTTLERANVEREKLSKTSASFLFVDNCQWLVLKETIEN